MSKINQKTLREKIDLKGIGLHNGKEVNLLDFIQTLEQIIGIEAIKSFEAMQLGDVHKTLASTSLIKDWVGFVPRTDIRYGLQKFIDWYRNFYNL